MKSPGLVFLIGFMGAGKSTVGPLVAQRLGRAFCDLDRAIEAEARQSIDHLFSTAGECAFRALESAALTRASQRAHCVVAVGGGAPAVEPNWVLLRRGATLYLELPPEALAARLGAAPRPLLRGLDAPGRLARVRALLAQRRAAYLRAEAVVCAQGTPGSVAQRAAEVVVRCRW